MNPQDTFTSQQPEQPTETQPSMPVYGQQPGIPAPQPPAAKNNKTLVAAVLVLAAMLLGIIVLAIFLNLKEDSSGGSQTTIARAYDSPVGLTPGMQSQDVKSGTFKLTGSYVTGNSFTREGKFAVDEGRVRFDMIQDEAQVNKLLQQLYTRKRTSVPFQASRDGANRVLTYDFTALLGYQYLYDKAAGAESWYIPAVEEAKKAPKSNAQFTLSTACDTALKTAKEKMAMSTLNLEFEQQEEGVQKQKAKISFAALKSIDDAVISFLESCYDLKQPGNAGLKTLVDQKRQDVTKSPEFTFWQEGDTQILEVSAPAQDTPFGGTLRFELSDLSTATQSLPGSVGSYAERRNQFGLAYSLCRVDPVVTTSLQAGYRFLRDDPSYRYPNIDDTGYYCTTLVVPSQFVPVANLTLKNTTGTNVSIPKDGVEGLRGFHDAAYEIEQYNLRSKRYPGPTEFRDIASSNLGALTTVTQAAFNAKKLVYSPTPAECVGTCTAYALSFEPQPAVQVRTATYVP